MVGVAPVEGSGRRLPQWMLGRAAADQVEKSDKTEVNEKSLEKGALSQTCRSVRRTKNPGNESLHPEEEKLLESSHVLTKCKTRRRKLKAKQADEDPDTNICEDVQEKKNKRTGRKSSESASRKRRKTKEFGIKSNEERGIQPLSEGDDVDLTVEDLMTIAEEYVRSNTNMEQEQEAKGRYDSRSRPPTTVSSRNESEDRNQSSVTDEISASYNRTSATNGVHSSYKSNSNSTEKIVTSTGGTGDLAHDMLDLFLGPLLKKPVEEKKNDFVIRDVALSQQFGKFGIESKKNIAREEIVPSMKKKSSLKDKVAMFLD